ncbi:MAG: DUF1738 domain-containing protein [Betaproteobacteria bacterium]|nr:DUF1738 domain-containing protein [Betaproteobacteria bacterium]
MQIGIDDLNPDLRLGVQAYSFLMTDRGPGSYRFSDFADVINARYDSPNARAIADAFRAVPEGRLTINTDRTVSVDLPDARAMALRQDVLSETPSVAEAPPAARGAQAGAKRELQDKAPPRDFRQEFTDKVVAAIESGQALPWDKPWHTMQGLPRNAASGKTYSGGNRVVLGLVAMEKGYNDPRWMTVKQANDLGGHVTKGEKGVMIERWDTKPFWKRLDVELSLAGRRVVVDPKRGVTPEGVHLVGGQTVDPARIAVRHEERTSAGVLVRDYTWKQAERALDLLVGRSYVVFNAEQCNGLKLEPLAPRQDIPVDVRGERLMRAMQEDGVRFVHQGAKAYYSPAGDLIALPPRETFKSVEGYYGTALHEMGHATGAEKRLNREGITGGHTFGSEGYAKEELRAELFSAFMSAETGIPHDDDQHTAYLQSWAKALKNDKNEIFRAAAEAGKAVDYVLAKERALQVQVEQHQSNEVEAEMDTHALAHEFTHTGVTPEAPAPTLRASLEDAGWAFKPNTGNYEKTFLLTKDKDKGGEFTHGKPVAEKVLFAKTSAQGLVIDHGWDDVPVPGTVGVDPREAARLLDATAKELLAKEHAHLGVTAVRGQNEPLQAEQPAPEARETVPTVFLRKPAAGATIEQRAWGVVKPDMVEQAKVVESRTVSPAEYDAFTQNLFASHDWLKDKGGEEQRPDGSVVRHVIEFGADQRQTLLIDPSGYNYARYVGVPVADIPALEARKSLVIASPTVAAEVSQSTPDTAAELKATWAAKGVSPERQSEMLAQIEAKAQPGAQVGPFVVGAQDPQESAYERAVQNFVRGGGNEKDARRTLDSELAGDYDPKHVPTALVFHGFAKPAEAEKLAADIIAEGNKQMLDKEDRKAGDLQAERPRQRAPQVGAELER